jgi:hypothetical protein
MFNKLITVMVLSVLSFSANAVLFNFTGSITEINDSLGVFQDVQVGDDVSGFFQYLTISSEWDYVNTSGVYQTYQEHNPDTSIWDFFISVQTDTAVISNLDNGEQLSLFTTQLRDDPTTGATVDSLSIDSYHGDIFENTPVVIEASLGFHDSSGALISGSLPPSYINYTDGIYNRGQITFRVDTNGDGSRESVNYVTYEITSLSSVPVPASIWLFGGALLGLMEIKRKNN